MSPQPQRRAKRRAYRIRPETAAATDQSTAPSAAASTGEPAETVTSVDEPPADAPAIPAAPVEAVTADALPAVPELPAEATAEPAATAAGGPNQADQEPSVPDDTDAGEETITEEPTPVVVPSGPTQVSTAEPEAAAPSESVDEEEEAGFFASLFTVKKPSISPGLETRSGGLVKRQRDRSQTGGPTADEDETQLAGRAERAARVRGRGRRRCDRATRRDGDGCGCECDGRGSRGHARAFPCLNESRGIHRPSIL